MKKYDSYKDSGIEWIGEIPEGWECTRLRFLVKKALQYGASESGDSEHEEYPRYIRITDITDDGKLKDEGAKYLDPILAAPYILEKGDLLFARSGATVGKTYLFNEEFSACFAGYLIKASCNDKILPDFLFYYTQSGVYENWKDSMFTQATIQNIGADKYNELNVLVPSRSEQQAIATYLNHKVGQIDASISAITDQIADLKAYRQSVISEAVTKGLNPDAKMKDSGIEWIGEIPEGWTIKKIKYVADTHGRIGFRGYTTEDLVSEGEGAFVIGGKHISNNLLDLSNPDYISWDKYYESPEIMVNKGDLITAQRGTLGRTIVVREDIGKATINPSLILINNLRINAIYLYWYMVSSSFLSKIELMNTSTAVPMISQYQLDNVEVPIPSLSEQQAIAAYLDQKTAEIDSAIKSLEEQMADLKALKQSVISEAVTGKIDVRDWTPNC